MTNQEINEEIVGMVFKEMRTTEEKFPGFPIDPIHAAAIVAEECGELQRAVLQWSYENGIEASVMKEAVQTAAMALRFLFNVRFMRPSPCEQKKGGKG